MMSILKADRVYSWWIILAVASTSVSLCHGGCSEVESPTEAVAGKGFQMSCISCKKREEVSAHAVVNWYFKPRQEDEFTRVFHYDFPESDILSKDFMDRLEWRGTQDKDVQTASIYISNVSFSDAGTYRCTFLRTLFLPTFNQNVMVVKTVELSVVAEAQKELTAVVSEIMMYVLIVVLQLWLIGVMVYCYKKISDENEARDARKARKAQAAQLIETKDNCDGVQIE
ncbi:sodium channel subunit beta-1 [Synchiropus splendidus]|uniref:sodium channel subunit beta-1 n=1 Tax=Synchiropus splendidus TaxID=270530 RepID=UPI00237E0216|nr:sodium channel subunit beta-1 [Synchiropus splendidus]